MHQITTSQLLDFVGRQLEKAVWVGHGPQYVIFSTTDGKLYLACPSTATNATDTFESGSLLSVNDAAKAWTVYGFTVKASKTTVYVQLSGQALKLMNNTTLMTADQILVCVQDELRMPDSSKLSVIPNVFFQEVYRLSDIPRAIIFPKMLQIHPFVSRMSQKFSSLPGAVEAAVNNSTDIGLLRGKTCRFKSFDDFIRAGVVIFTMTVTGGWLKTQAVHGRPDSVYAVFIVQQGPMEFYVMQMWNKENLCTVVPLTLQEVWMRHFMLLNGFPTVPTQDPLATKLLAMQCAEKVGGVLSLISNE